MPEINRLSLQPVDGDVYDGPRTYEPSAVGRWLVRRCRSEPFELAGVLSIARDRRIIGCTIVYRGTEDRTHMEPRGILAPPLIHGAPRLAVFHNHPNGSTTPSEPDRLTTERIVRCCAVLGLTLEDHLIIGRDDWGSMALHVLRRKVQRNDGGIRGYLSWDEFWRVTDGRSNVQPKFRHPETGETWAGRGSMAGWLRRELEAGRDIEDFRVMKAE